MEPIWKKAVSAIFNDCHVSTFAVALLYVWTIAFGTAIVKRGWRSLVDRAERRDLSIYRIGYDTFERFIINGQKAVLPDIPYFS